MCEIYYILKSIINKCDLRRCDLTINEHRWILSYFIEGLSLKSISWVAEINESDILDFISSAQQCKDKHLNTAHLFYQFLYEKIYIDKNIK